MIMRIMRAGCVNGRGGQLEQKNAKVAKGSWNHEIHEGHEYGRAVVSCQPSVASCQLRVAKKVVAGGEGVGGAGMRMRGRIFLRGCIGSKCFVYNSLECLERHAHYARYAHICAGASAWWVVGVESWKRAGADRQSGRQRPIGLSCANSIPMFIITEESKTAKVRQ